MSNAAACCKQNMEKRKKKRLVNLSQFLGFPPFYSRLMENNNNNEGLTIFEGGKLQNLRDRQ